LFIFYCFCCQFNSSLILVAHFEQMSAYGTLAIVSIKAILHLHDFYKLFYGLYTTILFQSHSYLISYLLWFMILFMGSFMGSLRGILLYVLYTLLFTLLLFFVLSMLSYDMIDCTSWYLQFSCNAHHTFSVFLLSFCLNLALRDANMPLAVKLPLNYTF